MHSLKQQLILLKHHQFTFLVLLTQLFLGSVFFVVVFSALTCTLTDAPPQTCVFICTLTVSSGRIFLRLCHVMLCAASCDNKHALFRVWPLTSCLLLQVGVKMVFALAACALLNLSPLLVLGVPPIKTQPEQVHLSYPGKCFHCHHKLQMLRSCMWWSWAGTSFILNCQPFCPLALGDFLDRGTRFHAGDMDHLW